MKKKRLAKFALPIALASLFLTCRGDTTAPREIRMEGLWYGQSITNMGIPFSYSLNLKDVSGTVNGGGKMEIFENRDYCDIFVLGSRTGKDFSLNLTCVGYNMSFYDGQLNEQGDRTTGTITTPCNNNDGDTINFCRFGFDMKRTDLESLASR